MTLMHNVKIKINEQGRGEVWLDDKPLTTLGTEVLTGSAAYEGASGMPPLVKIYTIAETLDQEVITDNVSIIPCEACLRIWSYDQAPEIYKALSPTVWDNAFVMRKPKRIGLGGMIDIITDWRDKEIYDIDEDYTVIIWGFTK